MINLDATIVELVCFFCGNKRKTGKKWVMCGICGEIRQNNRPVSVSAVERMTGVLEPRGPDDMGMFVRSGMAFGHRRLSILDLSVHGHQPMLDNDLGLGIVFNGLIYNYLELRGELASKGYRFFSSSDTEVILKAYHAWGDKCVERFYGMFSFALWERDTGRVVFCRDRLGIKPFYYTDLPDGIRFASTLPALLAGGGVNTEIDPVALHHYMSFHAVVPAPHTIIQGVRKLPPATIMTIEPDGRRIERQYWAVTFGPQEGDEGRSEEEWQELLLAEMRKAVERRLVADVPVGVLLSGGVDSSLIVGLLAEAGQHGLETFSIGFESVGGEKGDEFEYSDIVAKRFGTNHHKINVNADGMIPALEHCVKAMSEPMVSHDVIGFYMLSEKVSQHVKVVQSGQGADEVFGGYHWYPPMLESSDPVNDYARVFFDRDHEEFSRAVAPEYVSRDFSREFVAHHFDIPGAERPIDKALRLDTGIMLVDDPVKRVDNTSMAWGLEARVPFLDHDVVELAARIPPELKVATGGHGGKYILKEASRKVIPREVIDRPKGYFPVPALKYIQGEYLDFMKDILNRPESRQRGVINRSYVDELLKDPEKHITPLRSSKLWQVVLLEYWLQSHNI